MSTTSGLSLLGHLADLEGAAAELANTWRPEDPTYRAEVYRQAMMGLSWAYFAYFFAAPEHPDFAPIYNPVYALQPNPDDIYLRAPIRGDYRYRVSGARGTCRLLSFTTQRGDSGMVDDISTIGGHRDLDHRDIAIAPNGDFEIIFSAERPMGWTGNWAQIDPQASSMIVRQRMYDWENEVDPRLSIECLEEVPPKPRLSRDQILHGLGEMARFPARRTRAFYAIQNGVKDRVGFNVFEVVRPKGWLSKQAYWQACFRFEPDEALIVETSLPEQVFYWNLQLNDPLFNAAEYVYRLSSTNGHYARISSDGKFRAVIALEDPGVPNWLDPAGYTEGGIYGRWFDADSAPEPTLTRVKLADLGRHLPADTPQVSPAERADELRRRVRACQRRKRW